MPLSENEQRILSEIEKNFYEHDSAFADRMRSETVYKHSGRNLKWSLFGAIVGLVFVIATFTYSLLFGVIGTIVMLASLVVFESNLRRMGKAGWHDLTGRAKKEDAAGAEGTISKKFKRRLQGE